MDPVGDQFALYPLRRADRAERPWLPVQQRAHGVETVRGVADAQRNRRPRLLIVGVGVADADRDPGGDQLRDHGVGPR